MHAFDQITTNYANTQGEDISEDAEQKGELGQATKQDQSNDAADLVNANQQDSDMAETTDLKEDETAVFS